MTLFEVIALVIWLAVLAACLAHSPGAAIGLLVGSVLGYCFALLRGCEEMVP